MRRQATLVTTATRVNTHPERMQWQVRGSSLHMKGHQITVSLVQLFRLRWEVPKVARGYMSLKWSKWKKISSFQIWHFWVLNHLNIMWSTHSLCISHFDMYIGKKKNIAHSSRLAMFICFQQVSGMSVWIGLTLSPSVCLQVRSLVALQRCSEELMCRLLMIWSIIR